MTTLEKYLNQLDSGSYDVLNDHNINSELQKISDQIAKEGNEEDLKLSELNRMVFSFRKSFDYENDPNNGKLKGLSWMTSGTITNEDGTKEPFYWPDATKLESNDFEYFEKRFKESSNLYIKSEYGLMVYFGAKTLYSKHRDFKSELFEILLSLSKEYLSKIENDFKYYIGFYQAIKLAFGIAKESKLDKELAEIIEFIVSIHQAWVINKKLTLRLILDLSEILSENYSLIKGRVDLNEILKKNLEAAKELEKSNLWGAIYILDICLKIKQQIGNNDTVPIIEKKARIYEQMALEAEKQHNPAMSNFAEESLRLFQSINSETDIDRLKVFYDKVRGEAKLNKFIHEMGSEYNQKIQNQIFKAVSESNELDIINYFIVTPWYNSIDKIEKLTEKQKTYSVLTSLLPVNILDKFGNTIDIFATDEEKEKYSFWNTYLMYFQLGTQTMTQFFIEAYKAKKLSYNTTLSYLEKTWFNDKIKRNYINQSVDIKPIDLIKPGIKRIFEELDLLFKDNENTYEPDFITIIDSLTLKIEGLLRGFFEKIGIETFKTRLKGKHKLVMEKQLDDLLSDLQPKTDNETVMLEEDRIMLKFVLSEKAGLNLRNNIAHGLMDHNEYKFETVVILFSLIMKLSNYLFTAKGKENQL